MFFKILVFLLPSSLLAGSLDLGTGLTGDIIDQATRSLVLPIAYKHMGVRLDQDADNKFYTGIGFDTVSLGSLKSAVNSTADISSNYIMPLNLRFEKDFLKKATIGVNANISGSYRYYYALGFGGKYNFTDESVSGVTIYVGGDFTYAKATYPVTAIVYGLAIMLNRHLFDGCLVYTGFSYRWAVTYVNSNVMANSLDFSATNGFSGFTLGTAVDFFGLNLILDWRYLYSHVFSIIIGVEL